MTAGRGRGERAGLTREGVVETALRIAEREGVERLSLRRLAAALGVAPNAIYTYVPDKVALLDAVVDRLLGEVEIPEATDADWRDGLVGAHGLEPAPVARPPSPCSSAGGSRASVQWRRSGRC